jgi:23S rRNA pseudouridine1911/1915/1917 synthase
MRRRSTQARKETGVDSRDSVQQFDYQGPKGGRLDKFLVTRLPEFSRSFIQGLIKDGFVQVGDKAASKAGQELDTGQQIVVRVPPPMPSSLIAEEIPIDVIYENADLMVVNKPAGMVVHPAAGHASGTLANAALARATELAGIGGELRPGIVHRLDKDTSGLILIAKNDRSHRWLQDQFRLRKVKKIYQALVDGKPPTPQGRVEAPIGRDPSHRQRMAVLSVDKGREAVTEYHTLEAFPNHTLLEAYPLTGRTHQIRLHLAFVGAPIVGDTIYGHRKPSLPLDRHFLHAYRLTVTLPGEPDPRTFEAPLPGELQEILMDLRQ